MLAVIVHHSQFWPTVGRFFSVAAGLTGSAASGLGWLNRKKIQRIHVLVNGNLGDALKGIEAAAIELAKATAERDLARADLAKISTRITDKTPPVTVVTGNNPTEGTQGA